jgi:hypothetical protein
MVRIQQSPFHKTLKNVLASGKWVGLHSKISKKTDPAATPKLTLKPKRQTLMFFCQSWFPVWQLVKRWEGYDIRERTSNTIHRYHSWPYLHILRWLQRTKRNMALGGSIYHKLQVSRNISWTSIHLEQMPRGKKKNPIKTFSLIMEVLLRFLSRYTISGLLETEETVSKMLISKFKTFKRKLEQRPMFISVWSVIWILIAFIHLFFQWPSLLQLWNGDLMALYQKSDCRIQPINKMIPCKWSHQIGQPSESIIWKYASEMHSSVPESLISQKMSLHSDSHPLNASIKFNVRNSRCRRHPLTSILLKEDW